MESDLQLAFRLADLADAVTLPHWRPEGVLSSVKEDGSPVTEADLGAETEVLNALRHARQRDGLLGEEVGEHVGTSGRRWIVDGIDGTSGYAAGKPSWGTLLALETDGEIVLGIASSPTRTQRWWATKGNGTFTGQRLNSARRLRVSRERPTSPTRFAHHPGREPFTVARSTVLERLAGGSLIDHDWSHQIRVAEGEFDLCVWFAGDTWDHAAPSILVEEAGGRFTDHHGGRRLDTRTAIYSNGHAHEEALAAVATLAR